MKLRDHLQGSLLCAWTLIDFGTTRPIIFGCEQSYGFPIVWTWGIFVELVTYHNYSAIQITPFITKLRVKA